ncbi:MAG: alpha/beta hydrolase [Mycobacterium sp.]|nr:alpha/beta hydrolase [Mycobacterium sp.]
MSPARFRPPLDADLHKVLAAPLDTTHGVAAARQQVDTPHVVPPQLQTVSTENRTIDGPGGPIPIRIYRPEQAPAGPLPLTMYFHGGGFCVGTLDSYDKQARMIALGAGTVVVSVDYRLAPEHPFPAGVEDVWAATQWAAANGASLGADASRLAVSGDSAGATLSAVVAQIARDNGGPTIAFQALWYPATMWDFASPSMVENADAPIITRANLQQLFTWYAGDLDINDPPARMAPARASDLTGLPASYISTAGYDPLRDDGLRYAALLADANNDVQYHNNPTLTHAFLGYYDMVPAVTKMADLGVTALRNALLHPQ